MGMNNSMLRGLHVPFFPPTYRTELLIYVSKNFFTLQCGLSMHLPKDKTMPQKPPSQREREREGKGVGGAQRARESLGV